MAAAKKRTIVAVLPGQNPAEHFVYLDDGTVVQFNAVDGNVYSVQRLPDDLSAAAADYERRRKEAGSAPTPRGPIAF
jgi:hypothetical protein